MFLNINRVMVSAIFLGGVFYSALLQARSLADITIMAHRGLYQTYPRENLKSETCTAELIYPPAHLFLENTIPSIQRGYELNADTIEIDIHSTSDGKIVVFHDWSLECRTNGRGVTQDQTLEYLRSLDIGYGYTADSHATHPFRYLPSAPDYTDCMKRCQMPTLREVLQAFPTKKIVINMKSRNSFTLDALIAELKGIASDLSYKLGNLSFYCNDAAINAEMRRRLPQIDVPKLTMNEIQACLGVYFKQGSFPENCSEAYIALPIKEMRALDQNTINKLINDVHKIGGKFAVLRVDSVSEAKYVEKFDVDVIWTDRIDIVGPLVGSARVDPTRSVFDAKANEI